MTINLVMKVSVARRVAVRKRRPLAPSNERRDENESRKNGRRRKSVGTSAAGHAPKTRSGRAMRIELMNNNLGIAVIFGGRHDAKIVVAGAKDDDAGHEGGGEAPAAGVSGRKGLRHFRLPFLRRGPSPRDRRP